MDSKFFRALKLYPSTIEYLPVQMRIAARKTINESRDALERRLARAIRKVENLFYGEMVDGDGVISFDFWRRYYDALRIAIAMPIRAEIETRLANYDDLAVIVGRNDAAARIESEITNTINGIAQNITDKTRREFEALLADGVVGAELLSRIGVRFSGGHAEQIAVTELTRADSMFADALSARLTGIGITNKTRWLTAEDEKVCPICAPADHKLRDQPIHAPRGGWNGETWGGRFGRPPAHPYCRCQTVVELK